jgi:hypothetical protein
MTVLLLGAVALTACADEAAAPREGVRVEELTSDASGAFNLSEAEAGERVSLRATVSQVLSDQSFLVPSKDTSGDALLVVADDDRVRVGQELQLSGILRTFEYAELAQAYALGDAAVYREFEDKLVLVADLVDDDLPLDDQ